MGPEPHQAWMGQASMLLGRPSQPASPRPSHAPAGLSHSPVSSHSP